MCFPRILSTMSHRHNSLAVPALLEKFTPLVRYKLPLLYSFSALVGGMGQAEQKWWLAWMEFIFSLTRKLCACFSVLFANKFPHFTSFSSSFYRHRVSLVRMYCIISPVSGTHKALFISFLFSFRKFC